MGDPMEIGTTDTNETDDPAQDTYQKADDSTRIQSGLQSEEFFGKGCELSKWTSCLIYDQTSTGCPVLYGNALKKHFRLLESAVVKLRPTFEHGARILDEVKLHQKYVVGVRMYDEVVACANGYLCYEIKQRGYLVCNPITGNCIGVPYFNPGHLPPRCVSMIVDHQLGVGIKLVVISNEPGDPQFVRPYIYDSTQGRWNAKCRYRRRVHSPVRCCIIKDIVYYICSNLSIVQYNLVSDEWNAWNLPPVAGLEWIWLKKTDCTLNPRHRALSPAIFAYEENVYIMAGFQDGSNGERGIGVWKIKVTPPRHASLITTFPKGIWGEMKRQTYDFAQYGSAFVVFDMKYGCGLAYDIADNSFYRIPSFQSGGTSFLRAFRYQPSLGFFRHI